MAGENNMGLQVAIIPVTPFEQNCSLIWDEKTKLGAFVDPGGDIDRLEQAMDETGVKLEKILLTHGHLDHASAAGELAKKYGVKIEGPHEDDLFLIEDLPKQSAQYGFPVFDDFRPDRWLHDEDSVTVGGHELRVRHCPGHTPGHVVFYNQDHKIAIVGDVIFQGSIGRTDFPRGNHQQLIDSIRDRLFVLGDDIAFVPGHGPMSSFEKERKTNPFVSDDALGIE
ncbi:MAG: glyoxylase-like metal-dependent hydrolase (beta-lactamase superfamily II) [Parvibaculaceae bacterium]